MTGALIIATTELMILEGHQMRGRRRSVLLRAFSFTTAFCVIAAGVNIPAPAEAFDFKKAGRQFKRDFGKVQRDIGKTGKKIGKSLKQVGRDLNKDGRAGQIAVGIGAGVLVGAATDSVAAGILTGAVIVAAPEIFRQNFATTYRGDMNWASSVNSNRSRIVVAPGRKVSAKQQAVASSKVKEDVKNIQQAMLTLGLYKGAVDGDYGPGSRGGVKEFQRSLGEPETGALTAEQRHRLFVQASNSGFARTAALGETDLPAPIAISAPAMTAIPEYRLASSRFEKLTTDFLKAGSISSVAEARMLPDGSVQIETLTPDGQKGATISGMVGALAASPHQLSGDWAQIIFSTSENGPVSLNTRDDFSSPDEAGRWIAKFNEQVSLLMKLTGAPAGESRQPGLIVKAPVEPEQKPVSVAAAPEPKNPDPDAGSGKIAGKPAVPANADGTIVIADTPATPAETPRIVQAAVEIDDEDEFDGDLTGFDNVPQTCRQAVYVSFNFPGEDDPITHYNVIPPDGTIQMDNGDKTAYFTGNCVQGQYAFSYVHVQKGKSEKDLKDIKREGIFQLASNAEQCSVNLNTPTGSAEVKCF